MEGVYNGCDLLMFYIGISILACMAGFYGVNCTKACRYPSYGNDCQQRCNCAEHQCHVIIGCVAIGKHCVDCIDMRV